MGKSFNTIPEISKTGQVGVNQSVLKDVLELCEKVVFSLLKRHRNTVHQAEFQDYLQNWKYIKNKNGIFRYEEVAQLFSENPKKAKNYVWKCLQNRAYDYFKSKAPKQIDSIKLNFDWNSEELKSNHNFATIDPFEHTNLFRKLFSEFCNTTKISHLDKKLLSIKVQCESSNLRFSNESRKYPQFSGLSDANLNSKATRIFQKFQQFAKCNHSDLKKSLLNPDFD